MGKRFSLQRSLLLVFVVGLTSVVASPVRGQSTVSAQELWTYNPGTSHDIDAKLQGFAVSADGSRIALAYRESREIEILDGVTGKRIQTLEAPRPLGINDMSMSWNRAGDVLSVGDGISLLLWQFSADSTTQLIEVDHMDNPTFSWSPDDVLAVAWRKFEGEELRFIDGKTGEALPGTQAIVGLFRPEWSPDGRYLAVFSDPLPDDPTERTLNILDAKHDFAITATFPPTDEPKSAPRDNFLWMPDSSGLIGYMQGGALWRWSLDTQKVEIIVPGPNQDMTNLIFLLHMNERGDLLAVLNPTTDNQIHILNATTGQLLFAFPLASGSVFFAWGGDDNLAIYDGMVHMYHVG